MSELTLESLGTQAAEQVTRAACGLPSNIKSRHDKLLDDLDAQERILRELLDELRELNRSVS